MPGPSVGRRMLVPIRLGPSSDGNGSRVMTERRSATGRIRCSKSVPKTPDGLSLSCKAREPSWIEQAHATGHDRDNLLAVEASQHPAHRLDREPEMIRIKIRSKRHRRGHRILPGSKARENHANEACATPRESRSIRTGIRRHNYRIRSLRTPIAVRRIREREG